MMDGWDMGVGGWFLMTALWVALLAAIVWALASLFPARGGGGDVLPAERPEEILDRRLARGEIDPATYDELQAKLLGARTERR